MMNLERCKDDIKKLHALPPYNSPSNFVAFDGYFAQSIQEKYSAEVIKRAQKELGVL